MKAKDIKYVFEENPELKNIGTENDYQAYLETVFPESKIKDIVYHGGRKGLDYIKSLKEITEENLDTGVRNRGSPLSKISKRNDFVGAYFTKSYEAAKEYSRAHKKENRQVYAALINAVNPGITSGWTSLGLSLRRLVNRNIIDPRYITFEEYERLIKSRKIDSWIHCNYDYTVFDKNQQLILGSQKDMEGFKEFVSKNKVDSLEKKVLSGIFAFFIFVGLFLTSFNLTGNVVTNSYKDFNFYSISLFLIGILGFYINRKYKN